MYRFKLETLLNHRRQQEEIRQQELAETERQLADEQERLSRRKREQREKIQGLQAKQKENINVSDIILSMNYIRRLAKSIEDQKKCVRDAGKKVDQKRNELITIVKKRKALEKLKESEIRAHRQKMMQKEGKLMDEVASTRHARKMNS